MHLAVMPPFMQKCCSQFDCINQRIVDSNIEINTPPRARPISLLGVEVKLDKRELWDQFYAENTEMIITKVGRRMFPQLQLSISGLQENLNYCILVEMQPASLERHKYCGSNMFDENGNKSSKSGWTTNGQAESQPDIEHRIYVHSESPARGAHWMNHLVNFNKLKITNNAADHGSNVLLMSMHKYIPRIWIFQSDHLGNFQQLYSQPYSSFTFKETEFIAVTAYQNEKIKELKINNNPFAKGFRQTGHSRCKRKYEENVGHPSQINDEDSNSSFESSPLPHSTTTATWSSTGVPHNEAIDGTELSSPKIVVTQDSTSKGENNHLNARPSTPLPYHRLYRPWLDPPRPPPSLLPSPTLPDMSLYNFQFSTPGLLPRSFAPPALSQYHHFAYPHIRDWQETLYHMPWYYLTFGN